MAKRSKLRSHVCSVGDVHAALDEIAPFRDAADWDNVGLLAGRLDWPAGDALLAIDLTDAVAREVLKRRSKTVIVYHPPIFKGIRSVTPAAEAPTTMLPDLLAARVSILALHTALDAAPGGTNDVLLDLSGAGARRPLEPSAVDARVFKLVVFVPADETASLRAALSAAGAGVIGHYSECSFELAGRGSFRGDETTNPAVGRSGQLESVAEIRLEMVVPAGRLAAVVKALYENHSYEEPAFDLYPLRQFAGRGDVGMGRIGLLKRPMRGEQLLRLLGRQVDLGVAQVIGDLKRRFTSVTAAAGSFGAKSFRDPTSLVLTGELKHHDGLELLRRGVTCVCLGHDRSERPALRSVRDRLRRKLPAMRIELAESDVPAAQRYAGARR